jgi:hypothetical protein
MLATDNTQMINSEEGLQVSCKGKNNKKSRMKGGEKK